jgi:nitrite reductase (NADH) large subunit
MTSNKERLVVVGNGMAGARFVEDLLARGGGDRYEIVVFGDEPYGNYNRILLSGVLAGSYEARDIFLNPLDWYAKNGVTLHAGVRVIGIDRPFKHVDGERGIAERYDKVVLATGATPFLPRLERLHDGERLRTGAFVFRTLDDCDAIVKYATGGRAKRAIVLGGGLLGLEAARGLLHMGLEVHVVHLMDHLMEVQLDRPAARLLQQALVGMGVRVHLKKVTVGVLGEDRVTGIVFDDGTSLEGDLLVVSAGIRPNAQIGRDAGLEVERGIVVGDDLRTSDPQIFALGECVQHRGRTYGLVAPLWEQSRVLADVLSGKRPDARYEGSPRISTKLKVMGIDLAVMGEREAQHDDDEEVTWSEPSRGVYKKLVVRGGKIAGAILLGDPAAAPAVIQAFDRGTPVPANRAELVFGAIGAAKPSLRVEDLADEAQICNCNGVSKGAIVAAARGGCRTLKMLCEATRAGTGCGTCKRDVQALFEAVAGDTATEDPSIHWYVPGVPMTKPDLVVAVRERGLKSVSSVFRELAGGKEDAASKPGLASLLKTIWGKEYEDERDARFINDRVHANIQRDGTFSVIPRIFGGVTSPAQLRTIADVAERHHAKMVKITGGQRIDLLGIPKEELPAVWRELGMPSGHAYSKAFRTCKTCVGTDFCRYGVGDSTGLGIAIEQRFQGLESPAKLKLATAGCPRNCSEATTKDVGAVAVEGGRWEILVGGAAGSRVRKGDLLTTVTTHDEVLVVMGRFMQYYRENAKYLERTYDFVERVGIDHLRRVLVDDAEGICARLDEAVQAAVDACVDPWKEADAPVHEAQFERTLVIRRPESLVPRLRAGNDGGGR